MAAMARRSSTWPKRPIFMSHWCSKANPTTFHARCRGWLSHRRLTFALSTAPSLGEFIRYAAVAWFSAGFNYAVFVALMLVWPDTQPFVALVIASLAAMVVSYISMRFGAFRVHGAPRF